ncbi:MAG TPA: hypothetical protein PKK00_11475 [Bacteroidales bacterium]|nr:hypothetical protein [Bacteroidales bacterium]HPS17948.1 hypothetical protein [Bacteroidales bacterium]
MNKMIISPRIAFIALLIVAAAFMRLIPHWPNFTPIAAIALFGGASLNRKWLAFFIPLVAMFVSDMIIGFHSYMASVYICFAITVFMGMSISKNRKASRIALTSVASSLLFFIITNFAVWYGSPFYPQTLGGLMGCYAAGLPFFNDGSLGLSFLLNGMIGDLFYNGIFFGALYFASLKFPVLAKI